MLLEVFGHLFVSLLTSLGYIFFCTEPRYIAIVFCLSWQADNGGLLFGNLFGKRPFAHGISPKKTQEGIIGAIVLCVASSQLIWFLSQYELASCYISIAT
jgi:CDP-diglyceride synthetase